MAKKIPNDPAPLQPTEEVEVAAEDPATVEAQSTAEMVDAGATPDSAGQTQSATPAFHERLASEFGFQDISADNAAERALEALRERNAELERVQREYELARPYVAAGQQYYQISNDPAWQEFQKSRQAPVQAAEQKADPRYERIAVDQRLIDRFYERKFDPATGEEDRVWRPDTPPSVREQYEQSQVQRAERAELLVTDPAGYLAPLIEQKFAELSKGIEQKFQETQAAKSEAQVIQEFESTNPWLFDLDPITRQPKVDRFTGQPVLSQEGMRVYQDAEQLRQRGLTTEEAIAWAAKDRELRLLKAEATRAQAAATAVEKRDETQQAFLKRRAGNTPSRAGSLNSKTRPQNRNVNPGLEFRAAMQEEGLL